jgi:type VI secretion system protein ImpJ
MHPGSPLAMHPYTCAEARVKLLSPVIWSEGMHLAQHHFQAQSRYFEELAGFALEQLAHRPWGLIASDLDPDALRNGVATVLHARGIMPDGTLFQFPHDPPPAPLELASIFSPTQDAHVLLLALPLYDSQGANCADDEAPGGRRFSPVTVQVVDDLSGTQERPVTFSRKNFRLLLDGGDTSGLATLPIARIRRDGAGHFIYDPQFIPPALQIGASRPLQEELSRIIGLLDAKAAAIMAERAAAGDDAAGYAAREISRFWLAHAIHSALPPLRHILATPATPPDVLFAELSRLAGALCTFSLDSHPRDLPLYDHAAPEAGFATLAAHIRRHLEVVLPSGAIVLPLQPGITVREGRDEVIVVPETPPVSPTFFRCAVADDRAFGSSAHWYLAVRSSGMQAGIATRVPELVKVCASRFVARLVSAALPGLGLEYVASPPAGLDARPGLHYFRVHRTDPCWKTMVASRDVGVYVPAAIPDASVALAILLDA